MPFWSSAFFCQNEFGKINLCKRKTKTWYKMVQNVYKLITFFKICEFEVFL